MKNNLTGWRSVFRFSFVQEMKSKSIKISTLIICLIILAIFPIITLINGTDIESQDNTNIKKVYVVDYTGLNLIEDLSVLKEETYYNEEEPMLYKDIEFIDKTQEILNEISESETDVIKQEKFYKFEQDESGIYMKITYNEGNLSIKLIYSKDTKVEMNDVDSYKEFVNEHFQDVLLRNQKISKEGIDMIQTYQKVEFSEALDSDGKDVLDSDLKEEETKGDAYVVVYGLSMIIFIMLMFAGERIAVSIVVEKSSKVMEYLMTSVKPMAIVIGKVSASLLILAFQFVMMFLSLVVSVIIAGFLNSDKTFKMPSIVTSLLKSSRLDNVSPIHLIIGILIIFVGFVFFGMLAALSGAAVSKIEEVSEAAKVYGFIMLIGFYLCIFVISGGSYSGDSFIKYLACLLPISSPFISPGVLITSNLSILYGMLSLGILVVVIVFLTKFVSNVYESMIYYNGSPLKIKDIINISKRNHRSGIQKKHANEEEGK